MLELLFDRSRFSGGREQQGVFWNWHCFISGLVFVFRLGQ